MDGSGNGWQAAPVVMVIADHPGAQAVATATLGALGIAPADACGLAEALARLNGDAQPDGVYLELTDDAGPVLDALLLRIDALVRAGRCRAAIALPVALIDRVMARITEAAVQMLCDPDALERSAALGLIAAGRRTGLRDTDLAGEAQRLHQLGEEVARIARALAKISEEGLDGGGVSDRAFGYAAGPRTAEPLTAEQIRALIRARRLRDRYFSPELFADPAWDMLLDLMAARLERRAVAVSSLCIAAAVPPTTALRWIRTMTEAGLFVREDDQDDGRRVYVVLSDRAAAGLNDYFAAIQKVGQKVGQKAGGMAV